MEAVNLIFQGQLKAMNYCFWLRDTKVMAVHCLTRAHVLICSGNDILTRVLQIIIWQECMKASVSLENLLNVTWANGISICNASGSSVCVSVSKIVVMCFISYRLHP